MRGGRQYIWALFGTVAFDDITWRPVTNASAYDLEWSYSGAGSGTIFEEV